MWSGDIKSFREGRAKMYRLTRKEKKRDRKKGREKANERITTIETKGKIKEVINIYSCQRLLYPVVENIPA